MEPSRLVGAPLVGALSERAQGPLYDPGSWGRVLPRIIRCAGPAWGQSRFKNKKLHEELAKGLAESGGTAIPLDRVRLGRLLAMIARALVWLPLASPFGSRLRRDCIHVLRFGDEFFEED